MADQKTAIFSMRMEPTKKKEMEEFFEGLGLTLNAGVNLFFEHCIMDAGLPFDVKIGGEKMKGTNASDASGIKSAQINLRMNPYKKGQMEYTFKELGMTPSEAVNIYFEKCLSEWGIPFRVGYHKPNAETLAAMQEMEDMDAGLIPAKTYSSWEEAKAAMDAEDAEEEESLQ